MVVVDDTAGTEVVGVTVVGAAGAAAGPVTAAEPDSSSLLVAVTWKEYRVPAVSPVHSASKDGKPGPWR